VVDRGSGAPGKRGREIARPVACRTRHVTDCLFRTPLGYERNGNLICFTASEWQRAPATPSMRVPGTFRYRTVGHMVIVSAASPFRG
jgi:hypothetical protein